MNEKQKERRMSCWGIEKIKRSEKFFNKKHKKENIFPNAEENH